MNKTAQQPGYKLPKPVDWGRLHPAIKWKETGGHPDPNNAVGDNGLAVGGWQIHPNAWKDATGKSHMAPDIDPNTGRQKIGPNGQPLMRDLRKVPQYAMGAVEGYWKKYEPYVAAQKRKLRDQWVRQNSVNGQLPQGTVVPMHLAGDPNERDAALLFHYGPSYAKDFQDRHGYWNDIDSNYLNPQPLPAHQTRVAPGWSVWNAWKGRGAQDTRSWPQYMADIQQLNPGVDFNKLKQGTVINTAEPYTQTGAAPAVAPAQAAPPPTTPATGVAPVAAQAQAAPPLTTPLATPLVHQPTTPATGVQTANRYAQAMQDPTEAARRTSADSNKQYGYKHHHEGELAEPAGLADPIRLGSKMHMRDLGIHGQSGKMTRRELMRKLLGEERADKVIASAASHRSKNKDIYRGWFRGDSVDRPIKVDFSADDDEFRRSLIAHGRPRDIADALAGSLAGAYKPLDDYGPDAVLVNYKTNYTDLLHELTHPDSVGMHPDDAIGITDERASKPHKDVENIKQLTANTYYGTDGIPASWFARNEIAPVLSEIRMALEQRGVDTTNPDALREAFTNILDKSDVLTSEDPSPLRRFQEFGGKYRNNPKFIESLVRVIMGIADNSSTRNSDTVQYA